MTSIANDMSYERNSFNRIVMSDAVMVDASIAVSLNLKRTSSMTAIKSSTIKASRCLRVISVVLEPASVIFVALLASRELSTISTFTKRRYSVRELRSKTEYQFTRRFAYINREEDFVGLINSGCLKLCASYICVLCGHI